VEIREPHAFVVESIHVRRLQHRISRAGQVAITLVVSEDEDDVRLFAENPLGESPTTKRHTFWFVILGMLPVRFTIFRIVAECMR
jgi:hypothetical protein